VWLAPRDAQLVGGGDVGTGPTASAGPAVIELVAAEER